jgi:hypothetical protein
VDGGLISVLFQWLKIPREKKREKERKKQRVDSVFLFVVLYRVE